MKKTLVLIAACLTMTLAGCGPQQQSASEGGSHSDFGSARATTGKLISDSYDFFLLNLSWSPEYCNSHPSAPECAEHATFVMHGLWPERSDGSYPENCSQAPGPANPAQYADVYPDPGLLAHEWKTHGTCSGLSPDAYFNAARTAYKSVTVPPKLAHLSEQTSLPPVDIKSLFQQSNPAIPSSSFAISCGNNYLTAVEVCLDKNLHAIACGNVKTCRANTVRIPKP